MKYVATKEQEHQLLLMMMLLVATSLVANLHNNVEEQSTAKPGHLSVRMYLCIFVSLYLCITEPRDVYVHLQQQQQQQHQQSINPRTQAPVDSCAILCINAWA